MRVGISVEVYLKVTFKTNLEIMAKTPTATSIFGGITILKDPIALLFQAAVEIPQNIRIQIAKV